MDNAFLRLLTTSIAIVIAATGIKADITPDSIYTLKHAMKVHITAPDSALKLLDVMESRGLVKPCLINAQRCLAYSQKGQPRMILNYGLKAYQDTALRSERLYYLQTMSCVSTAYQRLENYEQSIRYLTEGIQFSREIGHKQTEANFLFMMGENYYELSQKQEAHNYFNQAIQLLENEKGFRMKPMLSYFYGQLSSYLTNEEKYEEAIAACYKREGVINLMQKQKGIPQGYIDQQLGYLYIKQAYLYAVLGNTSKASALFSNFSATRYSLSKEAQTDIITYQLAMKQYKQITDQYRTNNPADLVTDTISRKFVEILNNIAKAYREMNDFQKAFLYQQKIQVIEDSLNIRNKTKDALELATIYKLQEKEWHIRQKDEQLHKYFVILALLGCAFTLTLVLLWLVIHHMNITKKKNLLMANKQNSQMVHEEEIDRLQREGNTPQKAAIEDSINKCLFRKMERLIKDEKLYLIPELSRQDMLQRFSIDKNRFGQMLQENTNMTFSQYLTEIRLKHALTELKIHPNYTIQAISEESGFANTRNFQRLFKAAFDMTPSDYKKIVQEKQHREPPMD